MNTQNFLPKFVQCGKQDLVPLISDYIEQNRITVDSYWEGLVSKSNVYKIEQSGEIIGWFAIYNRSEIVLFYVYPRHANLAQELFARVKKYETVTMATVVTGDEFLMSHCLDNYTRIEKQAYFSLYTDKPLSNAQPSGLPDITLRLLDMCKPEDAELTKISGDFLESEVENIKNGYREEIYAAELNGETVGFGVVEYGTIAANTASIGMFVLEKYRQRGIAAKILKSLQLAVESKGCAARSGCWYYNHNSKKSMERAGAYSKTRLIKFYF